MVDKLFKKLKEKVFSLKLPEIKVSSLKKPAKRIIYYFKIWLVMSKNSFLMVLTHKKLLFIFLLGKVLRFAFFALFLFFLVKESDSLAGYNATQTIFFFLTFNVIDVLAQFLFREVYRFRPLLVSGDLDLILAKPMSSLFRVLMGGADVIDLVTIPPLLFAVYWIGRGFNPTFAQVALFVFLIVNGLIIATAFHILVLSLGIITLEIDHTIMIYRDLVNLGKLPVDIYRQPLKGVLTYFIPVGIMISLPAKALIGLVNPGVVVVSFFLGGLMIFASLKFWNFALKKYTSASS